MEIGSRSTPTQKQRERERESSHNRERSVDNRTCGGRGYWKGFFLLILYFDHVRRVVVVVMLILFGYKNSGSSSWSQLSNTRNIRRYEDADDA